MPSMKQGETWTPICVPGCTEDFMLHIYTSFKHSNLGIVLVFTDHSTQCFEECQKYAASVWDFLWQPQNKFYAGANKPSLHEVVDQCCIQMIEIKEMKEV